MSSFFSEIHLYRLLHNVRCIVWDYDGTLYHNDEVVTALKTKYMQYIHGFGRQMGEKEFEVLTNQYGSWAAATSMVTNKSEKEIVLEVDSQFNKLDYIFPNPDIVCLISNLKGCRHLILSNASESDIRNGLKKIGFPMRGQKFEHFEKIFGRESISLKPAAAAFAVVEQYTG